MLDTEIGPDIPDCGFEDHPVINGDGCDCDDEDEDCGYDPITDDFYDDDEGDEG